MKTRINVTYSRPAQSSNGAVRVIAAGAQQPYTAELPVVRPVTLSYALSVALIPLLAVSSVSGLAFGQRGLYEPVTSTSFVVQDVITLLVALPLLAGCLWAVRRGSLRGLLLWMGTLFYIAYAYSYAVLGMWLTPLFLVHASIVSMSLYSLIFLLISTDAEAVRARFSARTPARLAGGFVALMAALLGAMWVSRIVQNLLTIAAPTRVDMVVWPLDLVIAFPALFWGGVWLWRKEPLGYVVGGIVLLKAAAEGLTLVAQTVASQVVSGRGDDLLPAYTVVGVGGLVLLVLYLRTIKSRVGTH